MTRLRIAIAAVVIAACAPGSDMGDTQDVAFLSLVETLGGLDTTGYARALEVRDFVFPEDHGPHDDFRTEWWYVTGNLAAEDGRDFGFQFTIFRNALAPVAPGGPSSWATNQAYMGHFALTDIEGQDFRAFERFARGGGGLAGAQTVASTSRSSWSRGRPACFRVTAV
jgi:predicted secreted hydrolase